MNIRLTLDVTKSDLQGYSNNHVVYTTGTLDQDTGMIVHINRNLLPRRPPQDLTVDVSLTP